MNSGYITEPLKTLLAARNKIRYYKKNTNFINFRILLREGVYEQDTTFLLTKEDSGLASSPIIYKALDGENVIISGGKAIEKNQLTRLSNTYISNRLPKKVQNKVLAIPLSDSAIFNYGSLTARGVGTKKKPSPLEIFVNETPLKIAQWPNDQWIKTNSSLLKNSNFSVFYDRYHNPNKWLDTSDIWLHGYWQHEWADSYVKFKKIDKKNNRIIGEEFQGDHLPYSQKSRWKAINILEELDSSSEYYIDRNSGYLYFIPPRNKTIDTIAVSILESPILRLKKTNYIKFENISFEHGRGHGIVIENSSKIVIDRCKIRNVGQSGVVISKGLNNTVKNSLIKNVGESAIIVDGGDRAMLTRSHHLIVDNHINQFGRWVQGYSAGVIIRGVGNKVINNQIHNGPHAGIIFTGNDHLIQQNEIYNVAKEAGDVGVIYTGRDWSMRGTVIKYNYLYNFKSEHKGGVIGIYLDDLASGISVYGNIIEDTHKCILIGGGRDNLIENNILSNCNLPIWADDRGRDTKNDKIVNAKTGSSWDLFEKLKKIKFKQPPYSTRYPKLKNIVDDLPFAPKGNSIVGNIKVAGYEKEILRTDSTYTKNLLTIKNNTIVKTSLEKNLSFAELLTKFPRINYIAKRIASKPVEAIILNNESEVCRVEQGL